MPAILKPRATGVSADLPRLGLSSGVTPSFGDDSEDSCVDDLDYDKIELDDLLSTALSGDTESSQVIDAILKELSDEAQALKVEREAHKRNKKNYTQISIRRVDALKKIGDLFLKKRDASKKTQIDIKSAEFQLILKSLLSKVRETMVESGLGKEQVQVFFTKLSANLETWEEEIVRILSAAREAESKGD